MSAQQASIRFQDTRRSAAALLAWSVGFAAAALLLLAVVLNPGYWPYSLALLPVLVSLADAALTPLWRAAGVYRYYAPLFFLVERAGGVYELHGGTARDYLDYLRWSDRGRPATRLLLAQFLAGLLRVAEEVQQGRIPPAATLRGTSYFFSDRTVRRLGFRLEAASLPERCHFLLNLPGLALMYSFARGRPALPPLARLRRLSIGARELAERRTSLETLLARIGTRSAVRG